MSYINLKYKPKDDLVCDFYLEPAKSTIRQGAEQVAAESSVGTWTKIHTEKPYMRRLAAKVFRMKRNRIRVAYPLGLFEPGNVPQILSSVAGNVFGMKAVKNLRLDDISFPEKLVKSFKGPEFGINGVREIIGVRERPLVGTIIKPKLGLRTKDHASIAYEAWAGGCDVVKDDENLSSQSFNPFEKRVKETLGMKVRVESETGEKKVYLPNVTAETGEMLRRARLVKELGGEFIMVDVLTCGFSALQTLRNQELGLGIHGHRAMHAAMTRNKKHGISMLVIAKLARLIGIDELHIGTAVGKMEGGRGEVQEIGDSIQKRWHGIKPLFAVCSGGLHPGLVPRLVKMLGNDIIMTMGGGIHGHPGGTKNGAKAARQAVDAVVTGISLKEYAKEHKELDEALKQWK